MKHEPFQRNTTLLTALIQINLLESNSYKCLILFKHRQSTIVYTLTVIDELPLTGAFVILVLDHRILVRTTPKHSKKVHVWVTVEQRVGVTVRGGKV